MLNDSIIILKKELRRIFTDRKLLFMLVVLPMGMLPLMYSFMGRADRSRDADIAAFRPRIAIHVPVSSQEGAGVILSALGSMNAEIIPAGVSSLDSMRQLVSEKEIELLLVLPRAMDAPDGDYPSFDISAYHNSTGDYSQHALGNVTAIFQALDDSLVSLRVAGAGLPPGILSAVTVNSGMPPGNYDLAAEGSLMGKIIGVMVPFFIVIYLFANAMKVGLDTVAGEKERGTLAVLLVNQVGRLSIVLGKMLSVMIAAIVGAISSVIGLKIASGYLLEMMSEGGKTVSGYTMGTADILQFGVIVLPLAVLISSIVLLVSTWARNLKEGQGMIMPVYVAVMVMGLTTMQSAETPPGWMRTAPVFNSLVALKDIFTGGVLWQNVFFSAGSSLLAAAVLVFITLKMFNDERILFRV